MRKHFLVLMLLSLLPLAGWADDADVSSLWLVSIDDVTYGEAVKAPVVKNVSTGDAVDASNYDVEYYDSESVKQTVTAGSTKLDAGNYTVKVIGKGGFTGSITESFNVKQATLTWTLKDGSYSNFTTVYKKDFSSKAITSNDIEVTGNVNSESVSALFDIATQAVWAYTGDAANWKADGTAPLVSANSGYEVVPSGVAAKEATTKNYKVTYTKNYVKVKQAEIDVTSSEFTAAPVADANYNAANGYTYNGKAQPRSYTITYTYGAGDGDKLTLNQGTDFTAYYNYGTVTTEVEPWQVNNDIRSYIKTVKNQNFVAATEATKVNLGIYKISKSETALPIIVRGKSEVYSGNLFRLTDAEFIPGQLADGDRGLSISGLAAKISTETGHTDVLAKDVKTYYVVADYSAAKITKGGVEYPLSNFYEVATPEAEWEITPKELTISATATDIVYGKKLSDVTTDITVDGAISTEADDIKAYYNAVINTAYADGETTPYSAWTADTKPNQGRYPAAFIPAFVNASADHSLLNNYTVKPFVGAALNVSGAKFIIQPTIGNVEYGTAITESYLALDATSYANATVTGTPVYEYKALNADESAYSTEKPATIGKWTVRVTGLTGTGNYQDGDATPVEQDFEITQKTVSVKVSDLDLWEGATYDILQQKATLTTDIQLQKAYQETIRVKYSFNEDITNLTVNHDTDGKQASISFATGYTATANAILVALDADDDNSAHYKLVVDAAGGKLAQVDLANPELEIDGTAASVTKITDAIAATKANTNTKYDVVLKTDRKLFGGSWNIMVLPFSVTPMEFITAIGNKYAVFNTLKSANVEKNTVSFSLNIDEIPANTPFLVKPVEDVNYTTTTSGVTTYLKFASQEIEDKNLVSGVPTYAGIDKVHFIGTYVDGTSNNGGSNVLYGYAKDGKPTIGSATNDGVAAPFTYRATSAILVLSDEFAANAEAPIILIEEADGSTTVIRNINAEGVAVPAEGWYNLNGVKLQGVPTEKGVYINNGKKVIIK
ncbi:MAG: hypothetical protein IJ804_04860 [Prevotella sp.]|nr:hypothetical protein [Prevotella sp.]